MIYMAFGVLSVALSIHFIKTYGDAEYQKTMRENTDGQTVCMIIACFLFWFLCIPGHLLFMAVDRIQRSI